MNIGLQNVIAGYFGSLATATMAFAFGNALMLDLEIASARQFPSGGQELYVAALKTQVVELLNGVPVLEIPKSLHLQAPIVYRDVWTGISLLVFKLVILAPLVPATKALITSWRSTTIPAE
jgi:hypothetical protein